MPLHVGTATYVPCQLNTGLDFFFYPPSSSAESIVDIEPLPIVASEQSFVIHDSLSIFLQWLLELNRSERHHRARPLENSRCLPLRRCPKSSKIRFTEHLVCDDASNEIAHNHRYRHCHSRHDCWASGCSNVSDGSPAPAMARSCSSTKSRLSPLSVRITVGLIHC